MKIPIRNLYFILLYAWDALEEREDTETGSLDGLNPQELLARILCLATRRLIRRGLNRDYLEVREDSAVIRGRIDFPGTVKRALLSRAKAHVVADELSADNDVNRLLKATLCRLLLADLPSAVLRAEIAALIRLLRDVTNIRVTTSAFSRIRLHRNNRAYGFVLQLCELVVRQLLPEEGGTKYRFADFTRDEHEMRRLFQQFVTRFYRVKRVQVGLPFTVHGEFPFGWMDVVAHQVVGPAIPGMRADIVLRGPNSELVIDTKFTPHAFRDHYGKSQIQTDHLYQLFSYVHNLRLARGTASINGMLLYPTVKEEFSLRWSLQGHEIFVASLNLAGHWQVIEQRLLSFIPGERFLDS